MSVVNRSHSDVSGLRSAELDAMSLLDMAKSARQPPVQAEIYRSTEFAEEVSKAAGVRSFRQFCRHVATNYPVDRLQPYCVGQYLLFARRMQRQNLDLLCLVVFAKHKQHLVHSLPKLSDVHLLDFAISSFLYHSDRRLLTAKLRNIALAVDVLRTLFCMDCASMRRSDSALQNMNIQKYAKDVAAKQAAFDLSRRQRERRRRFQQSGVARNRSDLVLCARKPLGRLGQTDLSRPRAPVPTPFLDPLVYYVLPFPSPRVANGMFAQTLRPGVSDDPWDTMLTPPLPSTPALRGSAMPGAPRSLVRDYRCTRTI